MPTFMAKTTDGILEPGPRNQPLKPPPAPARLVRTSSEKKSLTCFRASPALYATPDAAMPLSDSPTSFSPSPYVVNHKRRGPRLVKSLSQSNVGDKPPLLNDWKMAEASNEIVRGDAANCPVSRGADMEGAQNGSSSMKLENSSSNDGPARSNDPEKPFITDIERCGDNEDVFDLQNLMSTASHAELDENGILERSLKSSTPFGEYYDAFEEISNEAATSSFQNMDAMLREIRLNLLVEIDRRKQAEQAFEKCKRHWQKLNHGLSPLGVKLSDAPISLEERDEQPLVDPADDVCQQLIVARSFAATVERDFCRAEIELEIESQIESKKFEISRLKDRLQYYEAANREMSQRNQETIETARQDRLKRKRRRRWLWGTAGLAVVLGAASMVWSYLPASGQPPSQHDSLES